MKSLVKKVAALLPLLEARGPVYFFALVEREDINRWDVTLSAEWSDTNYTAAIHFVAEALTPTLESYELTNLAGVVIMPSSGLDFQDLPESFKQVSLTYESAINVTTNDWGTRGMFVFKQERPPVKKNTEGHQIKPVLRPN